MVQVRSSGLTFFTYCGSSVGRLVGTVQSGEIDLTSVFTTANTRQIFSTSGTGASQAFVPGNAFSGLKTLVPGQGYAIVGKLAFDFPQGLPSSSEGSLTQALRAIGSAVATAQGKPYAVINASATAIATGTTVNFTATGSTVGGSGIIIGYDWNFGTGNGTSVSNAPSITFNNPGTFLVTLRVLRDSDNVYSDRVTRAIVVTGSPVSPTPNPNPPTPPGPSPTPPSGSYPIGAPSGYVQRTALPTNATLREFWLGNSVSDTRKDTDANGGVDSLVASVGGIHSWGRIMIPGSPLSFIRQNADQGFTTSPYGFYPTALANYKWDIITFQPFDRPVTGDDGSDLASIQFFLNIVANSTQYANSSEFPRPWIYQRWPRKSTTVTNDAAYWNSQWTRAYTGTDFFYESRAFFDTLMDAVRTNITQFRVPRLVPVGDTMWVFNQRAAAGQIPGYSDAWGLYNDNIHLTNAGAYLITLVFYSSFYYRSPVGLPVPSAYGTIDSSLVTLMQNLVWEVVQNHSATAYVPSSEA